MAHGRSPRWSPRVEPDNPRPTTTGPVPLVVMLGGKVPRLWQPKDEALVELTAIDKRRGMVKPSASGDGRFVAFERGPRDEGDTVDLGRSSGLFRCEVVTGEVVRARFEPTQGLRGGWTFSPSPDGSRIAVLELTEPRRTPEERPTPHLTLSVAAFEDDEPVELAGWTGLYPGGAEVLAVQWSPDGSTLAVSAVTVPPTERAGSRGVHLINLATGTTQTRYGLELCGPMSWSPTGDRLLVTDPRGIPQVHTIATATTEAIPSLPKSVYDAHFYQRPRPLGWADDDTLLVARSRSKSAASRQGTTTISRHDLHSGATVPLIRWECTRFDAVIPARMQAGFWSYTPETETDTPAV